MKFKNNKRIESWLNQKGVEMMNRFDDLLFDVLNRTTYRVITDNASVVKLMEAGAVFNAVEIEEDAWLVMDNKTFEEQYNVNELQLDVE